MLPGTMLSGPGLPEEAFAFDVSNFFGQVPEVNTVPMKKVDLARSSATLIFMQELASKQDELLVAMMKVIESIEVGQGEGKGSSAWTTVQTSVTRDYNNILEFCQAGLDKLLTDYPVEETDAETNILGSGGSSVQNGPVGDDREVE